MALVMRRRVLCNRSVEVAAPEPAERLLKGGALDRASDPWLQAGHPARRDDWFRTKVLSFQIGSDHLDIESGRYVAVTPAKSLLSVLKHQHFYDPRACCSAFSGTVVEFRPSAPRETYKHLLNEILLAEPRTATWKLGR
jgi:hypothetical protein